MSHVCSQTYRNMIIGRVARVVTMRQTGISDHD